MWGGDSHFPQCPYPAQSHNLRLEQENGGWAGISHKGVLVINGSGVAPFFSVAP